MIVYEGAPAFEPERAAVLQFAFAAVGTGVAVASGCPAIGAASLAALVDGGRYARHAHRERRSWSIAIAAAIALALAVFVIGPGDVTGWLLIAAGALGLLTNAATALAALPLRLGEFGRGCGRASGLGYCVLALSGAALLVHPATWICVLAAGVIVLLLVAGLLRAR